MVCFSVNDIFHFINQAVQNGNVLIKPCQSFTDPVFEIIHIGAVAVVRIFGIFQ